MFPLFLWTLVLWSPVCQQTVLDGIRVVESGGRDDCPDGDGGVSIGPFQIGYAYWKDATEFDTSIGGAHEDCRDRTYAERVVRAYMERYVPGAWRRAEAEVIARTHNGGPRGARKAVTRRFWNRVWSVLAGERALAGAPSPRGRGS